MNGPFQDPFAHSVAKSKGANGGFCIRTNFTNGVSHLHQMNEEFVGQQQAPWREVEAVVRFDQQAL